MGRTTTTRDHALVLFHEPEAIDLLLDEELGFADILDLYPPHHLANDDFDVLVVDVDALQAVDLLDFVDQVGVQRLLTEDRQDIVRIARPVHERLARADAVAFLDVDVHAARQRVLSRLAPLFRDDDDLALPLDDAAVADDAVDFRDDRRLARLSRFEQLDHARQTARDVLRLGRLARDLGEDLSRVHRVAVLDHEVGVRRHVVLARHLAGLVADFHRRLLLLVGAVHDDLPREAGDFVHFLVIRDVGDEVLVLHGARILGQDRERVRIPLDEDRALLDRVAVAHLEARTVDDRVALAVAALVVLHHDRPGAVHHDQAAARLRTGARIGPHLNDLQPLVADDAGVLRVERRLLVDARRRAADVERAHRELRARLADRLRRDDANRQAELHQLAGREVASVAARAATTARGACEHRTNADLLDPSFLDIGGLFFVQLLVGVDDHFAAERVDDLLERDAADDALAQRLDDFARLDDRPRVDPVHRPAIELVDDHVLRDVDETAGQVARVGCLERRVGETLAGAVRRDEVVKNREAFTEVRRDRRLDDFTRRLGHQAAHARQLADLLLRASRARVGHDVNRVEVATRVVELLHLAEHRVGDLLGDFRPHGDDLVVALAVSDRAFEILPFDLDHFVARGLDERRLLRRDDQVVDADRQPRTRRIREAERLQRVEHLDGLLEAVAQVAVLHQLLQPLLLEQAVDVGHPLRQRRVEDDAADGGVDHLAVDVLDLGVLHALVVARNREVDQLAADPHADRRQRFELARFQREHHIVRVAERAALALGAGLGLGQVVAAEHDVLRRNRNRLAAGRRQDVVRGHHQDRCLDLRFRRERDVDRHLVAVEVGVERRADERMDPDRLAFDQHRLERLDAQAVQRRRAVQKNGMLADDFLEDVPHFRPLLLDHLLRLLDRGDETALFELVIDERLEQLERHLLGKTALVQLQLGADDDDRTPRVVDALAEQVLAEPALLALERVAQRLQRTVVRPAQHAAAAAVVEQRVHRFLEHALFVADDDVGRLELDQLLQPVVAVDDAAIEIVEVRRGEAAAVKRDQRTQFRRNDRDHVEDHPLRLVGGLAERVHHLQPLGVLQLLLDRVLGAHLLAQLGRHPLDVDALEQFLDCFRAHLRAELLPVVFTRLAELIFVEQLVRLEVGVARLDDDVGLEVEDALEIAQRDIEQVPDAARQPLEEPDVADRRGQRDVAKPLAADLGLRDFHTALVANDAAVLHPLVLAAQAFPVGDRPEDLGAEEPVAFGLEGAVVDRLRLRHLAVRPGQDLVRGRQRDANRVEVGRQGAAIIE